MRYLAIAFTALAGAIALAFGVMSSPTWGKTWAALEAAVLGFWLVGPISVAVYALWRHDRIRRRARSAYIRLHHVERRLASLKGVSDSGPEEGSVA